MVGSLVIRSPNGFGFEARIINRKKVSDMNNKLTIDETEGRYDR